jgi:polar amino acid transport system substrate-binding protein
MPVELMWRLSGKEQLTKLKGLAAATSLLALTLTLGACSGSDSGTNAVENAEGEGPTTISFTGEAIQKVSITIGFGEEAPYSFEEDDELQGASIALAKAAFAELGIDDVEGIRADFGSLIPGLNADRFDAVVAGMAVLPYRCEQASFGDPELMYTTALMTKSGNQTEMRSLEDAKGKGLNLVTGIGTAESDSAEDLGINTQNVSTREEAMDAVITGQADAFAGSAVSLNWMAKNNPEAGVEVSDSFVQEIDGVPQVGASATIFRTNDDNLREKWNTALNKIVSDEATYLDIVGDYGVTAEERPDGSITTDQLCTGDLPTADS